MKHGKIVAVIAVATLCLSAAGQAFTNLDFERATIAPTPPGGSTYPADPLQALPGWIVGGSGTVVAYNAASLGAPAITLMGPDFPNGAGYDSLQGSYSVYLQYFGTAGGPPTLSQTGFIPAGTQSISFLVPSGQNAAYSTATVVTLNGVSIPLVPAAGNRVAGDVSAFAGSTAQLTFSTINAPDFIYFDDIRFSSASAPEPNMLTLLGCGALLLTLRRRRNLHR
jgi:hypothetical protein